MTHKIQESSLGEDLQLPRDTGPLSAAFRTPFDVTPVLPPYLSQRTLQHATAYNKSRPHMGSCHCSREDGPFAFHACYKAVRLLLCACSPPWRRSLAGLCFLH
eukprot:TRINITY_DN33944_c0_g1_i1.p1 TRINITY_DN33944_c0_g1~~TRINITY_DN33944_c0_g1_i1.p1  ORF type:complete len:103 (+),score=0.63 TRINITY_DN33944_c0_g1_i1:781-1089(+)